MVRASLVVSLLAAAASTLAANHQGKNTQKTVRGAFIFELAEGTDPASFEDTVAEHGTTRMKINHEFFNCLSLQLHDVEKADEKVAKLAAMPAVKAVYPVKLYDLPEHQVRWAAHKDITPQQASLVSRAYGPEDIDSPQIMTQVDRLKAKGITGKDVKIALLDTGIDFMHAALGQGFGPGHVVSFGQDFVGDDFNGDNTPVPGNSPMDCNGHGTFCAGVIAAQENPFGFTGNAPGVTLGAYRVFGCRGGTSTEVLLAAFLQAFKDGADIISASFGHANGWAEDAWAVAATRIVEAGVPCIVSAGNDGEKGLFDASVPATAHRVTAITSFENVKEVNLLYNAEYQMDGGAAKKFGHLPTEDANWPQITLPVWATSLDTEVKDDACKDLPAKTPDLKNYIVLIRRGGCSYKDKISHALAKGAKYVLVYNDKEHQGVSIMGIDISPKDLTAASMIDAPTGATFIEALKAGKKLTLTMVNLAHTDAYVTYADNKKTGGAVSFFASMGPTFEMDVKPQFGAVGGGVLSTYVRSKGSYAVLSGTSMSCPQAAAVYALIRQVRGKLEPSLVENLLSANADPQVFNDGEKFYPFKAPVAQQGSGLLKAHDAAYATTILTPSNLSFNDTDHFAKSLTFSLMNTGSKPATYHIDQVPAITMYTLAKDSSLVQEFPNEAVNAAATLKFSETSITLRRGQAKTITVSAEAPQGLDVRRLALWSGWVTVNGTDGASLSLPYQGLAGSLRSTVVLARGDTWLSLLSDPNLQEVPAGTSFLLPQPGTPSGAAKDLLMLCWQLAMGSARVAVDVVPLDASFPKDLTIDSWGTKIAGHPFGLDASFVGRGIAGMPWDGRLATGKYAPAGKYKMVTRALRIFGDAKKLSDWDVSESPAFFIKYEK